MRKIFISIFLFNLTQWAGFAQPIVFNKMIKVEPNLTESGNYIQPLKDGGYLFTSSGINFQATDSTKFNRIFICTVDSNGNLNNKAIVGKNGFHYGVGLGNTGLVQTKKNEFGFTGYSSDSNYLNGKVLLIKINQEGGILWLKQFSIQGKNAIGTSLVYTDDDGFAIACFAKVDSANKVSTFIIKTDSNGNVEWQKEYVPLLGSDWFDAFRIILMPDKGYCIAGRVIFNDNFIQVQRTDSLGNLIWTKQYGKANSSAMIKLLNSGNLILFGRQEWSAYLTQITSSGDTVYSLEYALSKRLNAFGELQERQDGYVLMGNRELETPDTAYHITGFLVKIDLSRKVVWQRTFVKHNYWDNVLNAMTSSTDGGYIITGFAHDSMVSKGTADVWLVKTDSFGCDVPGCQIKDGIAPLQPEHGASFDVYPNPVSHKAGQVNVRYLLRQPNQELILTVADMNGHQLAKIPFYSYSSEGSLSMDISWLNAGIYTVSLHTEMGITYQKLVVQ